MSDFKPGLWRHYKGGMYTAIALVQHHETRQSMVLYCSHTYGHLIVREWRNERDGRPPVDAWTDQVQHEGQLVPRFEYIGELPSRTPIDER